MGQDFLTEGQVPKDIAEAPGANPDTGVPEIGPGIGPLTVQLARRVAKAAAIELDHALYPILAETLAPYPNAEVVPEDTMKLDPAVLVPDKFSGLIAIACANLPYNITAPILTALIETGCFASTTVMIQRGVTLCICVTPGSNDYGAFPAFCQYHTQLELFSEVGPKCFLPAPKVTSVMIRLVPRSVPSQNLVDDSFFFQVVRTSLAQRRKIPLNGFSSAFGNRLSKDALCGATETVGLSADIRDERLGIPELVTPASVLQSRL